MGGVHMEFAKLPCSFLQDIVAKAGK